MENHLRILRKRFLATDSVHLMTLTHPGGQGELVSHPRLTRHENRILNQRMKGVSLREIAHKKGFTLHTGRRHIENITLKTGTDSLKKTAALILQMTMEKNRDGSE